VAHPLLMSKLPSEETTQVLFSTITTSTVLSMLCMVKHNSKSVRSRVAKYLCTVKPNRYIIRYLYLRLKKENENSNSDINFMSKAREEEILGGLVELVKKRLKKAVEDSDEDVETSLENREKKRDKIPVGIPKDPTDPRNQNKSREPTK